MVCTVGLTLGCSDGLLDGLNVGFEGGSLDWLDEG